MRSITYLAVETTVTLNFHRALRYIEPNASFESIVHPESFLGLIRLFVNGIQCNNMVNG